MSPMLLDFHLFITTTSLHVLDLKLNSKNVKLLLYTICLMGNAGMIVMLLLYVNQQVLYSISNCFYVVYFLMSRVQEWRFDCERVTESVTTSVLC